MENKKTIEFSFDIFKKELYNYFSHKKENKEKRSPSIKHYTWVEDEQKCSSWIIDTGYNVIMCGDAGHGYFIEVMKDCVIQEINKKPGF